MTAFYNEPVGAYGAKVGDEHAYTITALDTLLDVIADYVAGEVAAQLDEPSDEECELYAALVEGPALDETFDLRDELARRLSGTVAHVIAVWKAELQ